MKSMKIEAIILPAAQERIIEKISMKLGEKEVNLNQDKIMEDLGHVTSAGIQPTCLVNALKIRIQVLVVILTTRVLEFVTTVKAKVTWLVNARTPRSLANSAQQTQTVAHPATTTIKRKTKPQKTLGKIRKMKNERIQ